MRKESASWYREVQGDENTTAGCREPEIAVRFAKSLVGSPDSDSPGKIGRRETYSSANVPTVVIEVTNPTKW